MTTELFLVLRSPYIPQNEWLLTPGTHVIGRSSDCEIVIFDDTVSRKHARILVERDEIHVVDLESRNGTFINDVGLQTQVAPLGGILRFGRIECIVADTLMLTEFADSGLSTVRHQKGNADSARERLSKALKPVFDGLLEGLAEKEIAVRLDLSPNTIKHHIGGIYETLHVASRSELMALFVRK